MKQLSDRWEHGSDFHSPIAIASAEKPIHPWSNRQSALFGSGRDGLRALIMHGRFTHGWRRCWLPSFFCQQVSSAIQSHGVEICVYPDSPLQVPELPTRVGAGDAVVVMNYFGLRTQVDSSHIQQRGGSIIEDHSHDPWSEWATKSSADYCLATLRKCLPVPEGSTVWSPCRHNLPEEPVLSIPRRSAVAMRIEAMRQKGLYLAGDDFNKNVFRSLFLESEALLATGCPSGISAETRQVLNFFPVKEWRARRMCNYEFLRDQMIKCCGPLPLSPRDSSCTPFSFILILETNKMRDALMVALIGRRIYPAILWPLANPSSHGIPDIHVSLSERLLSIHCDGRYNKEDMNQVGTTIVEVMRTL